MAKMASTPKAKPRTRARQEGERRGRKPPSTTSCTCPWPTTRTPSGRPFTPSWSPRVAPARELGGDAGVAAAVHAHWGRSSYRLRGVSQRPPAHTRGRRGVPTRQLAPRRQNAFIWRAEAVGRRPRIVGNAPIEPEASSNKVIWRFNAADAEVAQGAAQTSTSAGPRKCRARNSAVVPVPAGTTTRARLDTLSNHQQAPRRAWRRPLPRRATPPPAAPTRLAKRRPRLSRDRTAIQDQQRTAGNHQVSKARARPPAPMP